MRYLVYIDEGDSPILVAAFMWQSHAEEYIKHQIEIGIACYMTTGNIVNLESRK